MRSTITKLSNLFKEPVLQGVQNVIKEEQLFADNLSKNEAYKMYGRSNVDRWLKEKLVSISNTGKKGMIDRQQLAQVAACSNRFSYLMAIAAYCILGEELSLRLLIGGLLIFLATLISELNLNLSKFK